MFLQRHIFNQILATCAAYFIIFTVGIWMAWAAIILPRLKAGDMHIEVSTEDISWITSLYDLGILVSTCTLSYFMDRWGRVVSQQIAATGFVLAALFAISATTPNYLCTARFIAGYSMGLAYTATPTYIVEIASPQIRGVVLGIVELFYQLGVTSTMTFGFFISPSFLHWIILVLPLCSLFSSYFLPESPYYYCMRGNQKAAVQTLSKFRVKSSNLSYEQETLMIMEKIKKDSNENETALTLLSKGGNRRALKIILVVSTVYGFGGSTAISNYGPLTLPQHGIWNPTFTTMLFGWSQLVAGIFSSLVVDIVGRKPILLTSLISIVLITCATAGFFYSYQNNFPGILQYAFVPHLGNILFSSLHCLGVGQLMILYRSELFSTNVRSKATSISLVIVAIGCFLTNKIFLAVDDSIGIYAMYLGFGAIHFAGALLSFKWVVETKGKTLEEIQDILDQHS